MKLLDLHPYTKAVLVTATVNVLYNTFRILAAFISPSLFGAMVVDGIVVTGFLSAAVFLLGGHGLIRHRWPGNTVYERKRRPGKVDVLLIPVCFGGRFSAP